MEPGGNEPAHADYRATEGDFRVFERGLADARKVAARLFPRGAVVDNDAVLYDTHDLYIYSRSRAYPLPKFRLRGGYQVYRAPVGSPVTEREMARCAESAGPASVDVLRVVTERSFACAPWGTFGRIQKERRSLYRFVEGYWASMIHEYGHEYRALLQADPTPEMGAIDALVAAERLTPGTDPGRAADEARRPRGHDDFFGHDAGLRAEADLLERSGR